MAKLMNFTGTVLKNLFSKPVTVNYPAEPASYPERTRGHVEISIDDCLFCGLCSRSCPPGAITVDRVARTWTINRFDCIQCGYCTEKCPKKCIKMAPGYQEPMDKKSPDTFTSKPLPTPPVKPVVANTAKPATDAAKPAANVVKPEVVTPENKN